MMRLQHRSPGFVSLAYAAAGVAWIVVSDAALLYAVEDPRLAEQMGPAKGLFYVTGTALLLYLLLRSRDGSAAADADEPSSWSAGRWMLLAAGVLVVPLLGVVVYLVGARNDEHEALQNVDTIAGLKASQVESWVDERRGDAIQLAASPGFIERLANVRAGDDTENLRPMLERLQAMVAAYGYDAVTLLDGAGRLVVQAGRPHDVEEAFREQVRRAEGRPGVSLFGVERDIAGRLYIHFVVPLWRSTEFGSELAGSAILHADPVQFLYPLIQGWPTRSPSGESLLVRQDGRSVVYLSQPRHKGGAPLVVREQLDLADRPAAMAVRANRAGSARGVDYRGKAVLASWRPIRGTDWHIVAKLDRDEALVGARESAAAVAVVAGFAMLLLGLAVLAYLRAQGAIRRIAAERRSDELLRQFFSLPFIGMAVTSPSTKHWLRFNDRLCEILGYSREEMTRIPWSDMTHPGDLDKDLAEFDRVMRGESEGYIMEKRFVRKDGVVVDAVIDVKCVRGPDGAVDHFVATIDDITERKASELRLRRLARLYATLSECNQAVVHCGSQEPLFDRVCRAMVEKGGMKLAWIGMIGKDGKSVAPVASAGTGDAVEYVQDIRVSTDPDDPHGRGPTGTAMRENRLFWTEDFASDPRTAPWHERAARYGLGASAAMPLSKGGAVVGVLTVYAAEIGGFDEEMRGLLGEMGRDIGFALDNFEREARRLLAEATLRENERQFRSLFESSIDAILLTAPDGRILAANAAACAMLDRTEEEILEGGRHLVVDASDPRLPAALAERQRTGRFRGELTFVRKDGTRFPGEVSTSVFRDRAGELRTSMIIRDVSDRNRAEAQLREQIEELERWNRATLDREIRILEMKREVNAALATQGRSAAYPEAEGTAQ